MMQPVTPDHAVQQVQNPKAAENCALIHLPDTERFLQLYDDALLQMADSRLGLFSLPGRATFASKDAGTITRRAAELAKQQRDVYLHIHLHDLPDGDCSLRGSKSKVRAAIGLFSDIDARGPGRKKPPQTLCTTVEDAISVATEFDTRFAPLKTSLLIHSGHGIYPAILFKEPFLTPTAEEKALLESLGRRFHNALHVIASGRGWTGAVDYCDLAKVLRLPGCVNWKDPNDPKPVRLIHEDAARFDPSDLDELLLHLDERHDVSTAAALGVNGGRTVNIAVETAPQVPDALLKALIENHPQFALTWNHLRPDLNDQSCSGYDLAIASIAVTCGLTDQQITNLIMVHRTRFPGSRQERHGHAYQKYLERTIARAHQGGTSAEGADRNETQDQQAMEAGVGMPPQQASASDQTVRDPQRRGTTLEDNDEDQDHSPRHEDDASVHSPVDFLIAKVRATGDLKLIYYRIGLIAALSETKIAVVYQDLKAALGSKLNYNHFSRAIQEARARQQQKRSDQQSDDPRPLIITNDRLLDEIAADAIAALEAANEPPVLFRRGGQLVMIHPDEDGRPVIMRANEPMMRGRLARVARFVVARRWLEILRSMGRISWCGSRWVITQICPDPSFSSSLLTSG
jgi:hypothetical protein